MGFVYCEHSSRSIVEGHEEWEIPGGHGRLGSQRTPRADGVERDGTWTHIAGVGHSGEDAGRIDVHARGTYASGDWGCGDRCRAKHARSEGKSEELTIDGGCCCWVSIVHNV